MSITRMTHNSLEVLGLLAHASSCFHQQSSQTLRRNSLSIPDVHPQPSESAPFKTNHLSCKKKYMCDEILNSSDLSGFFHSIKMINWACRSAHAKLKSAASYVIQWSLRWFYILIGAHLEQIDCDRHENQGNSLSKHGNLISADFQSKKKKEEKNVLQ